MTLSIILFFFLISSVASQTWYYQSNWRGSQSQFCVGARSDTVYNRRSCSSESGSYAHFHCLGGGSYATDYYDGDDDTCSGNMSQTEVNQLTGDTCGSGGVKTHCSNDFPVNDPAYAPASSHVVTAYFRGEVCDPSNVTYISICFICTDSTGGVPCVVKGKPINSTCQSTGDTLSMQVFCGSDFDASRFAAGSGSDPVAIPYLHFLLAFCTLTLVFF